MVGQPATQTRFPWAAVILGLAGIAILVSLGTWQVRRLAWKEGLLAEIDRRIHSQARPLADLEKQFAESADVDYRPVTAEGSFVHDKERHFLATYDGEAGFNVYTPLKLADGRFVLVNRGFVPYDLKDAARRPQGQVEGTAKVTGLARNPLAGKPSSMVPDNDLAKDVFYWKDRDAMAKSVGLDPAALVPFFVDADSTPNPGGWPVGGVTIIDLPNNHLQYAVTWYGLAATLAVVLGTWLWRQRRGTSSADLTG